MSDELHKTANLGLVRLAFSHDTERWLFARYYEITQGKSETLLSLLDTVERWRTTPYDVLFEEMSQPNVVNIPI